MTIYADIVLVENLFMNFIILYACSKVLKVKTNYFRITFASLIGAFYVILTLVQELEVYRMMISKIILSVIMISTAFKVRNIKSTFKQLLIFYLISFVFGGTSFAILYLLKPENIMMQNGLYIGYYPIKVALLGGLVGFVIVNESFRHIRTKMTKKDMFCDIEINFNNKSVMVRALIDTGNFLKDPITNAPVIVVELHKLERILPEGLTKFVSNEEWGDIENIIDKIDEIECISKFRVIPFSSIGKQNGLLMGFKPNYIKIFFDNSTDETMAENIQAIIGIYDKKLTKNGEYCAIVGLDFIEGDNQNESFRTIKV